MKACAALANLPRVINQCGLSGAERRNKKKSKAMMPSIAKKSRQFCALPTFPNNSRVIAAASSMPTDWQAIVATIIRARLR